jgi:hypothetical protein
MDGSEIALLSYRAVSFLINFLVCGVAATCYMQRRRGCLGLIALSAGMSAAYHLLGGTIHLPLWASFLSSLTGDILWAVGCLGLLAEYRGLLARAAQLGASPNGGPAKPLGNSGAVEGPPSVS